MSEKPRVAWPFALGTASLLFLLSALFLYGTRTAPFEFVGRPFYQPLIDAYLPELGARLARMQEINGLLAELPKPTPPPVGGPLGAMSYSTNATEATYLRFLWDAPHLIDAFVLVPAQAPDELAEPLAFRLPEHYEIVARKAGQETKRIRFPALSARQPASILPFHLPFDPVEADTVEVTAHGYAQFAIGELFVFSGRKNIAPFARIETSGFNLEAPGIDLDYANDERTPLGIPQDGPIPPLVGYTSGPFTSATETVWIELRWSDPAPIDEVRFYPIERILVNGANTAGFPEELDLLAWDGAAGVWTLVRAFKNEQGESPGLNAVPLRFPARKTNGVRLATRRLWKPTLRGPATFALAEIEIRHQGIPLNADFIPEVSHYSHEMVPAHSKDGLTHLWSKQALTDGMSSAGRILHERDWLEQLSRRADLLEERARLETGMAALHHQANRLCWRLTAGLPLALLLGLVLLLIDTIQRDRRRLRHLREKLAADLHDDLGSNLSTISIYAQRLQRSQESQNPSIQSLLLLVQDSLLSLKEMVAVTSPRITRQLGLVENLRNLAGIHSAGLPYTFAVEPGLEPIDCPPAERRNLCFFLKEALNNIIRHSGADRIDIRLHRNAAGEPELEIRDNGCGVPPSMLDENQLPSTLQLRAEEMQAPFGMENQPEGGCRVWIGIPCSPRRTRRRNG